MVQTKSKLGKSMVLVLTKTTLLNVKNLLHSTLNIITICSTGTKHGLYDLTVLKYFVFLGNVTSRAYEPPEGQRRNVRLLVRCVRRSSLAMLYHIWSSQLQGISIG